ncbi:four and a half LIM domains protein 1 [Lates japonicus]|uniref:Four and a half LIM domains protein 1 n=1 Tax=Lates japonicus TaxID=270547 RepID=A0AAD3RJW8_LATJO|nr:four and a half LIM domains protein 1 [Lates japonicus]
MFVIAAQTRGNFGPEPKAELPHESVLTCHSNQEANVNVIVWSLAWCDGGQLTLFYCGEDLGEEVGIVARQAVSSAATQSFCANSCLSATTHLCETKSSAIRAVHWHSEVFPLHQVLQASGQGPFSTRMTASCVGNTLQRDAPRLPLLPINPLPGCHCSKPLAESSSPTTRTQVFCVDCYKSSVAKKWPGCKTPSQVNFSQHLGLP